MTIDEIDDRRLTALLTPYQGRLCDRQRPVEVYRNLRHGGYSVRQDGRVVAHCGAIMLVKVTFCVSAAGWRRSIALGKKTVHAWVRGLLTGSGMGTEAVEASKLPRVRYDRRVGAFVHDRTILPVSRRCVKRADVVALNARGMFAAYWS